ncbi:hypothetical protein HHX47_DHR4000306 [Lentinula edodes]|nr:hypothetical protein HHX47_DHR4000306 [Lentinula edodes]
MLFKSFVLALAYTAATNIAAPILRREVPQEHSHENILILMRDAIATGSNPQNLGDPVFGLLGDAAAAGGLGDTTDPDCLQQNLADLAFTNAKAAGNVTLMTAALIYRALERNTGSVGLASVACNSTTAVNSEIAAISQHQDPASTGAAATNKAIVLTLAQQIASIGGDPQDALKSGTFAPGTLGDPTAADSTTVTSVSSDGCTTEVTVTSTVTAAAAATSSAAVDVASTCAAPVTVTVTASASASAATEAVATATSSASTTTASAAAGQNLQTFTGDVGNTLAPAVTTGGRGFVVAGETGDSFLNLSAALQRSCSIQHNACADAANSGSAAGITVGDCDTQNTQCTAA